jgi:hypothetical protein
MVDPLHLRELTSNWVVLCTVPSALLTLILLVKIGPSSSDFQHGASSSGLYHRLSMSKHAVQCQYLW